MGAVKRLASIANWREACLALGVARVSAYRFWKRKANPGEAREREKPERALSEEERRHVLDVLNSQRFVDMAAPDLYLYVIIYVFSRYVVGWMVAHRENAELARRLIAETIRKQEADPSHLTIHADRGSSMKSKCVAMLL